ncbi:MAG: extracellular solute-binding protein [Mesorhizobium sp.]|nr:extracellular solute-binding protein [Mesorhizobium sp.]MBN9243235.1 extracellular solute-binding protein [Mesorhizobium sp.]
MRKGLNLLGIAAALLMAGAAHAADAKLSGSINVATWGGPFTDAEKKFFGEPFTAETGVAVNYLAQSDSPTGTALLQATSGNITIDVVNSENAEELNSRGLLADFPDDMRASLENESVPGAVLPYQLKLAQTAVVIACNPDIIKKCPTNPAEFFDLKGFPGARSIVIGLPWTVLNFALVADGVPADKTYPLDIDRAVKKLETIKGHDDVLFTQSPNQAQQMLTDKEVGIAYLPHGTAYSVAQTIKDLKIYWDGATMTNDGLVVLKDAPNKAAALAYVRWIGEHAEAQAGFTKAISYPSPSKKLKDLLDPALYDALPTGHNVAPEDDAWLVKNMPEVQKKFQQFLAGGN